MHILKRHLQGLLLTTVIAVLSFYIKNLLFLQKMHIDSLVIAILLGIAFNNLFHLPGTMETGIRFSLKRLLKIGIVMLGFRLSFNQVASIGGRGVILIIIVSTITLAAAYLLGKKSGLSENLSILIGTGTSICGASAIAAVAPVLVDRDGSIEDSTAFAISTVTLLGTVGMFLYPIIYRLFSPDTLAYSVWAGSSIHGVGQAVAAGFAAGEEAGQFATLIKLTRVLMLIPLVLLLGIRKNRIEGSSRHTARISVPWFVFAFLGVIIFNSLDLISPQLHNLLKTAGMFILTIGMAAMGLKTGLGKIRNTGIKPVFLGISVWILMSVLSYILSNLIFS